MFSFKKYFILKKYLEKTYFVPSISNIIFKSILYLISQILYLKVSCNLYSRYLLWSILYISAHLIFLWLNFLGTRKRLHDYRNCNLGKAKANAIVTRGGAGYNETELNAFINLFIYAQQFYGRKESDEFRLISIGKFY